ncbi:hypothetical protein GCM10007859_12340 [Brevundimonas denitrificans]|uniref:Uncharacterized protein n=1 Tax=Brevundimonas denitrificans TaxID=1443434 RepID=A0ABQ6BH08_9CAUL|nr:hypothetical protein [Brevundimonas denitrificans]GLS01223.1 hypothetical protein GCM10007859_12340 [Brevundimonas denitrificans]
MKTAMIRKALLSTLAATAVMTATPALAQQVTFSVGVGSPGYSQGYGYNRGYGNDLQYRAQRLAQQIDRASYNGRVSRGEAQRLRWEMQEYRSLEWRYARDGRLSQREYAALSYRLDRIQALLRMERRDRW